MRNSNNSNSSNHSSNSNDSNMCGSGVGSQPLADFGPKSLRNGFGWNGKSKIAVQAQSMHRNCFAISAGRKKGKAILRYSLNSLREGYIGDYIGKYYRGYLEGY